MKQKRRESAYALKELVFMFDSTLIVQKHRLLFEKVLGPPCTARGSGRTMLRGCDIAQQLRRGVVRPPARDCCDPSAAQSAGSGLRAGVACVGGG